MAEASPPRSTPEEAEPRADRDQLDRSLATGIAWTGGVKWVSQIFSWVTTLIVARLLVPEDFGIMGMATLVLGFIQLVNEFGIGAAIVQRKEVSEDLIAHLGAFSLALGGLFALCGAALAHPIALFFNEPRVQLVVVVLSVNFAVTSAAVVSRSMLTREMRFRALALVDGANGIITSVLTVVLAWIGWGYWALVAGSLASTLVTTGAYVVLHPFRPRWPGRIGIIARELEFGAHVVAARIGWYTYSKADFAVVGRMLGTAALGAYNIGFTLASLPVEKISALIVRVTPPVFSRVQDDPPELQRYLRLLTEGVSVVTFPIGLGTALVAPEFVPLVLGDQWTAAVAPLQLLALYGGFRSVTPFFAQILVATDHTRLNMWFSILGVLLLVPAFVVGARWGTTGVALAWVVIYPALVAGFHIRTTFRIIEMPIRDYLRSMWPAISSSAIMALAVVGIQRTAQPLGDWGVLICAVLGGALAYVASMVGLHRSRVRASLEFVRKLRRRSR